MKFIRPLLIVLLVIAGIYAVLYLIARPVPAHPFFDQFDEYPLVIGHADDGGTALWPGNTMPFLEGSASLGVDILEMDVNMSSDGQIVLMHDTTVDDTTDGTGTISEMTLAELKQLEVGVNFTQDDGQTYPYVGQGLRIPTLAEVFDAFPDYPMNIEIKQHTPPMAAELCTLIRTHGREEQVLVASFNDQSMAAFRTACPEVATAPSSGEVTRFVLLAYALIPDPFPLPYQAFQVPEESSGILVVRPGFVWEAQRRNLQIHIWTINDPADMQRFAEMGVDGIMTDRPDVLQEVLRR